MCFYENHCFSSAGTRFALVELFVFQDVHLLFALRGARFCSLVSWFLPGSNCAHTFFPARARFWKCDSWPEFFEISPCVWCDDSYTAAHKRIYARQKLHRTHLNFNNLRLRRIVGNIIRIFTTGFSFIFDNTFILMNSRVPIVHEQMNVHILICFA